MRVAAPMLVLACLLACTGCAGASAREPAVVLDAERAAIDAVVDDWHRAAAAADEERYFDHLAEDAVFLGTDATERWNKQEFRAYAHPHFAKGKAWSFTPVRRAVRLSRDGRLAWFDEDLRTPNLGPARGSGVLRKQGGRWRIVHYNLAITVPNERFAAVKDLLAAPPPDADDEPHHEPLTGRVVHTGEPMAMKVPKGRAKAEGCKDEPVVHNAMRTGPYDPELDARPLADVLVRLSGPVKSDAKDTSTVHLAMKDCMLEPRMVALQRGQTLEIVNRDPWLTIVEGRFGDEQLFSVAHPKGASPQSVVFQELGLHRIEASLQPWTTTFVWVSEHPYVAVSDMTGTFTIPGIPDGDYVLEAWHALLGKKMKSIRVIYGRATDPIRFAYDGSEPGPPENQGELDGLF